MSTVAECAPSCNITMVLSRARMRISRTHSYAPVAILQSREWTAIFEKLKECKVEKKI